MDKNYYYRLLGVRPDATPAQIKAAYEERIARLDSADYADEPEYARRKKAQVSEAYSVITGKAAPVFRDIKGSKNEKADELKEKLSSIGASVAKGNIKGSKLVGVISVIVIVITLSGIVGAITNLAGIDINYDDDYVIEEIDDAKNECYYFTYYDMLDTTTISENDSKIDWDDGVGNYGEGDLYNYTMDILYWLDIYDVEMFFEYVTGEENYFMDRDDYDCAVTLASWMTAPDFEEIAGATNLYTDEPILNMTDYMEFLKDYVKEYA